MNTLHLTYLFDPLCGWCHGASPALDQLAAVPQVRLTLAPTGLFSGTGARAMDDAFADYAWGNDVRIERITGQAFSALYRKQVLGNRSRPFDSGPATRALTAVALTAPERERDALHAIEHARYVQGQDVTDTATLAAILAGLGLTDAAVCLAAADGDDELQRATARRTQEAVAQMRRFGTQGVPSLLVQDDACPERGTRLASSEVLFGGQPETLLERLRGA